TRRFTIRRHSTVPIRVFYGTSIHHDPTRPNESQTDRGTWDSVFLRDCGPVRIRPRCLHESDKAGSTKSAQRNRSQKQSATGTPNLLSDFGRSVVYPQSLSSRPRIEKKGRSPLAQWCRYLVITNSVTRRDPQRKFLL